ncbi:MAG: hypothetical protein ABI972_06480 [Acidobacteriota bacterium]
MNRKLVWLNILLVGALGAAGYQWRQYSLKAKDRGASFLKQPANPQQVPVHVPAQQVKPVQAANYLPAAQQLLFAKDRNPDEIIDVKPPDPPKPVPAFPAAYGVISMFGDTTILLSEPGKPDQKGYRIGEKVGPFLIAKLTQEEITFAWDDKTFVKNIADLKPKEAVPQQSVASAPAAVVDQGPMNKNPPTNSEIVKKTQQAAPGLPGIDTGAGDILVCVAGDSSPAGTVQNGWRKSVTKGPFGTKCLWTKVGPQ